jgi:hypothetical protein
MLTVDSLPLPQALAPWHEFYALLGGASATMIGLLFVAASVTSGTFSSTRRGALRIFLSASVVHFSSILAVCLTVLAPLESWLLFGVMILGCGLFGLAYYSVTWRDTVRDGLNAKIDMEDRFWYAMFPVLGYLLETGSAISLAMRLNIGCAALAVSMAMLLTVGIHNAWDITIWSITRHRQ